jgi:LAO/AO transport system kinase
VAIVAVDPSSRVTGGAILGDRIRMQRHHADPGVFVRSMASRGASGGLARTSVALAHLFRNAGFDITILETVGVGQDEVEIAGHADVTAVVLVPGMGDDVQAIKAGIMEIADVFVINKADRPGAEQTEREIESMLSLGHEAVPIYKTVAIDGTGVAEFASFLEDRPRRTGKCETMPCTIDHLGIAVRSIDESLDFYAAQLGLEVSLRETVAHERVDLAMLPAGDARIELLEATDADSPIARFIEKRGPGLHHVALKVPDLAAVVARLEAKGVRLLGPPQKGAGGHTYVFVHPAGTGGVLWELIQA